jgi:hypothetical protein
VVRKITLLVASLGFTVLLAEGMLRLSPRLRPMPRTYVGEYQNHPRSRLLADPILGWRLKPNLNFGGIYHSNSQGFRSPFNFDSTQPCRKIALAGDSFTFGAGVKYDQTFGALIEAGVPGSCVDNMGMVGFGLDQLWQTVHTQALQLDPRLVMVAFTSPALTRSEEAYRATEGFNKPTFKLINGELVPETADDRPDFLVRYLQHHSSVWRVIRLADRTLAHRYPHGEWWYLNAAILDAIREDCRKSEVPLLFVYIPSRDWGAFPSLRMYMASNHANFIDLSQGQFALTTDMYIPKDGHLNEKGHRQVADAVLDFIAGESVHP